MAPAKRQRSAFCGKEEELRSDEQNPLADFVISAESSDEVFEK